MAVDCDMLADDTTLNAKIFCKSEAICKTA